ncbi:hypothetical protein P3X46_008976 [Hevea brasiliensis]|uniref:Uncharacterized protein n=1 Tax=Hevea brasiliensis TaxID=3981 RepID=A0ABQ9MLH6_HEVBR|nr:hypothetical protein P3X46_008976 [Hevea brasiliensis]
MPKVGKCGEYSPLFGTTSPFVTYVCILSPTKVSHDITCQDTSNPIKHLLSLNGMPYAIFVLFWHAHADAACPMQLLHWVTACLMLHPIQLLATLVFLSFNPIF